MIRRIRKRFIRIAMLVLTLTMLALAFTINIANWIRVRTELSETIGYLTDNLLRTGEGREGAGGKRGKQKRLLGRLSESRYFSVTVREDGTVSLGDLSHENQEMSDELLETAQDAIGSGHTGGFFRDYLISPAGTHESSSVYLFLNCESKLDSIKILALISAATCLAGFLLAWFLVSLFSLRAIHPLIENAVRQKQFITDAGHELKTPLTAISANMDVLELDIGENEWIRATRQQIAGMGALIKEMIYLSRMDEDDSGLEMADFNLSKVVLEIAEPFEGMAEYTGRNMKLNVQDNLYIHGNEAAVQRLVSILCDNAVKYAPEGDEILLELSKEGKQICLMTENAQSEPLPPDELKHLFDRFYRGDKSRSKESGGFGIGLSVARAVMEKHGGTIQAVITQEGRMRILCKFRSFVSGKRP